MRSIRGGTLGWNIEIYSTPTNQFDWSVSRAYVIGVRVKRVRHPLLIPSEKKCLGVSMSEPSLVPRPSFHGVPVRGPGNNGLRMRLIKTARYA